MPDRQEARSAASPSRGSMKVGPSDDYKALLRGEIAPEEYVKRTKTVVDARIRCETSTDGAHRPSRGGDIGMDEYEGDTAPVRLVIKLARRIHRWRFITGGRRAAMILLVDDLLAEIHRLEILAGERR